MKLTQLEVFNIFVCSLISFLLIFIQFPDQALQHYLLNFLVKFLYEKHKNSYFSLSGLQNPWQNFHQLNTKYININFKFLCIEYVL